MIHAALMDAAAVSSLQRVLLHLLNVIEWRANGNHIDESNQMLGKGGQVLELRAGRHTTAIDPLWEGEP